MAENKDKITKNTTLKTATSTVKKQETPSGQAPAQPKHNAPTVDRIKPVAKPTSAPTSEKSRAASSPVKPVTRQASVASKPANAAPAKTVTPTAGTSRTNIVTPLAKTPQAKAEAQPAKPTQTKTVTPLAKTSRTKTATPPSKTSQRKAETQPKSTPRVKADTQRTKAAIESAQKKTPSASNKNKNKQGGSGSGGSATATIQHKRVIIIIAAVAAVMITALVLGLVFGLRSCSDEQIDFNPVNEYSRYGAEFATNTKVGFYGEVKDTVSRVKPVAEVKNESEIYGNSEYPKYGKTLNSVIGNSSDLQAARRKLIQESSYLTTSNTWNGGAGGYKWMDKDGYLYNGTTSDPQPVNYPNDGAQRQLYKHTAADGLYGGNVADDEPGIVKTVRMQPRGYTGYGVTGVYAPAGEVIKIELSEADMNATGGIEIHIGQALYNGKANNIWVEKNQMQRFPIILNTLIVNKDTSLYDESTKTYTAYVGSFVGGPLYVRNEAREFTVTISGGVRYSHFILGYTTQKEFEQNALSSAPYFDLEVWDHGVLHSGPKAYAKDFSYEDLYKAAVLWDKVASVTTTNGTNQGIVFLYDPFVAAGEAVAFPGQMSVNCPLYWMKPSLNYKQMVTSGAWGNYHEYHHNFQNFGVGYTGEVTNNALTLVSYSLFTKISQARQPANFGGAGLGDWNLYTSAPWALHRVNDGAITGTNGLAVYATLLHNFGQDVFISARNSYGANYFNKYAKMTHQDFSYFAQQVSAYAGSSAPQSNDYPIFVPVSSVYQTGRTYDIDGEKREIMTMQPYVIPYGAAFTVDLRPYNALNGQYVNGSVVVGKGFKYSIKSVDDSKADGKIAETDTEGVYTFTPGKNLLSGKIYVTLEITTDSGSTTYNEKQIADVQLILQFEQSHETNKYTLNRTTYIYDDKKYDDAVAAYDAEFRGYINKQEIEHTNPIQNCNTDIWFYTDTQANRDKYPNVPEHYFVRENSICVVDGKLYADEEGTYRIYLRGRLNCALYYSTDGGNSYKLGATVKDVDASTSTSGFRPNDQNTYFDLELKAGDWVYIKEVLICCTVDSGRASYIGVGMSKWIKPTFTVVEKHYKANGEEVASPDADGYDHSKTHYYSSLGEEVDASVANNAQPVPPASAAYVTAFRYTYEKIVGEFETEYFYKRKYTYDYTDNVLLVPAEGEPAYTVVASNYDINSCKKVIDGNRSSGFERWGDALSAMTSPDGDPTHNGLWFTVDMGQIKTVNRVKLYSRVHNNDRALIKSFILQGSVDGETFFLLKDVKGINVGEEYTVDFDKANIRYYRMIITDSNYQNSGFRFNEIEVWHATEMNGGQWIAPDSEMLVYGEKGWYGAQADSTFGHIYVGNNNATVTFEFEGTGVGVLSTNAYGRSFEVYIDGQKLESIRVKDDDSPTALVYLCDKLTKGKHRAEIKCVGEANIDSIVIYG